jgi:hypothetical protein
MQIQSPADLLIKHLQTKARQLCQPYIGYAAKPRCWQGRPSTLTETFPDLWDSINTGTPRQAAKLSSIMRAMLESASSATNVKLVQETVQLSVGH